VSSGVPEQPIGMDQTRLGAMNRALAALALLEQLPAPTFTTQGHDDDF
jgi:non-canonical (house-cleaning) NTP pyrophosphatase